MPSEEHTSDAPPAHVDPPTHPDLRRVAAAPSPGYTPSEAEMDGTLAGRDRLAAAAFDISMRTGHPGPLDVISRAEQPPIIPGYDIVAELARGGMGVVYSARDLGLEREVAIKTLLPGMATRAELVAQFVREAKITARLQHPGVPPIHALGTLPDGRPFLVMKLIRGRTLQEEIENCDRAHDLPRLVGVFEQICQTVGYAHSIGIIHRDLKPLNVMVGAFGEVQVMDWGLAREVRGVRRDLPDDLPLDMTRKGGPPTPTTGSTRIGRAKGTSSFMPPEQARGDWDSVDARADVFTLGGVLCTILTGRPPYTGPNGQAILGLAVEGNLDGAHERLDASGADPELISLAKRCLSPEAADRPGTGKVVAEAVAAYRSSVEERARRAATESAVSAARLEEAAHGHALAYCTLASALQDKGDLPAAIEAYHEALRLNPNFAPAYANLGVALHDTGDLPGAIAAYRVAIDLDPADPKVHSNLGIALREAGNVAGAITELKHVVELDPENPEAHFDLGNLLQAVGNLDGAIDRFEEARFLAPDNSTVLLHLAVAYLVKKRTDDAADAAREAIALNPLDPNADTAHAVLLLAQGDTFRGKAALGEAVRHDPARWEGVFRQLFPDAPLPSRPLDL
jgi:serine/threonine protein kinase/Tfp pilus assembly protein PilF